MFIPIIPENRKMENKKKLQYQVLVQVVVWHVENPALLLISLILICWSGVQFLIGIFFFPTTDLTVAFCCFCFFFFKPKRRGKKESTWKTINCEMHWIIEWCSVHHGETTWSCSVQKILSRKNLHFWEKRRLQQTYKLSQLSFLSGSGLHLLYMALWNTKD